ncbi:MAG: hypothetical protein ABI364_00565 [Caldimonas sp.]
MLEFMRQLVRMAGALSVAGAAALPLLAHGQTVEATDAAPTSTEGQVVARDLSTGKLRAATAEEAQALQRHRTALRRSPEAMQPRRHWSGAVGARLTDEFMTYSIVMRQADGKLVEICVDGAEAAAKAMSAPVTARSAGLPTE